MHVFLKITDSLRENQLDLAHGRQPLTFLENKCS